MENRYDNSSQKYSRGYATPENTNRYDFNQGTTGFADSLESQFFYDRPANGLQNQQPRAQAAQEYNVQQTSNYYQQQTQNGRSFADEVYPQQNASPQSATLNQQQNYQQSYQQNNQQNYQQNNQQNYQPEYPRDYAGIEAERANSLNQRYAEKPEERYEDNSCQSAMNYTTDDFTPSASTMQFASNGEDRVNPFEDFHKKGESSIEKKYTINTKGKILIAVYALVVVTVFALIILNTRLLKTMNSSVAMKEEQVKELQVEIDSLNSELNYLSSDEVINEKAEALGMTKVEANQ